MQKHYMQLIEKFSLQQEEKEYLVKCADEIFMYYMEDLKTAVSTYYRTNFNNRILNENLMQISSKSGISFYTVCFVFVAAASKFMLDDYKRANIKTEIFWQTIEDLKYKLYECKRVKNEWGTFVIGWYVGFFKLDIFKLGRFEFERKLLKHDYTFNEIKLKKGDDALFVHIPSCGKLTDDLRYDSYKLAYDFFKDEFVAKILPMVSETWLLYNKNVEIFSSENNIIRFYNDFDNIENYEDEKFNDAWRIFGKDYVENEMPCNTSLQKDILKWRNSGKYTGMGYGIILHDGDKIINQK